MHSSRIVPAMVVDSVSGTDWTDGEIDLIVPDYFAMLMLELRGEPYVKAHHNTELRRLTKRSRGSIEFKPQNISAVRMRPGEPWLLGYKRMPNFQGALIDGVARHLASRSMTLPVERNVARAVREDASLYIGPARDRKSVV